MAGFIKLHRGWRNTDGLRPSAKFSEAEAWLWLLENAAWKDSFRRNHKGQEVEVKRGEIHTSLRSMAAAWGWSKKAVETFITRLETVTKVVAKRDQAGSHLSIVNYGKYQDNGDTKGDSRGTAGGQPGDTQEEGKEGKEGKETTYAFFGQTIRLTESDLTRWRNRYFRIVDLAAELGSLDDWITDRDEATRKNWFHIASATLNKKHQAAERAAVKEDNWEMPIA